MGLKILKAKGKTKQEYFEELTMEGYSIYEWSDQPGAYYSSHSHRHDECICIVKGKTTFIVDNKEYVLTTGEKLYLSKNTVHESKNKFNETVTYLIGEKI